MKYNKVLAIAIDEYNCDDIRNLDNCYDDLKQITDLLLSKYNFDDLEFLYSKKDTTRSVLHQKLTQTFLNATEYDNILLLFSGHGEFNQLANLTYWQPSDAVDSNPATWLGIHEFMPFIASSNAHHINIIADSCFAGGLFQGNSRGGGLDAFYEKKSRQALTSGRIEKVSDGVKGGNSPFARTILKVFTENTNNSLSFVSFAEKVGLEFPKERKQTPVFGDLPNVGHDGGAFLFQLKKKIEKVYDKNAFLQEKLGRLFLELPDSLFSIIDELMEISAQKHEVVKNQNYNRAAELRARERVVMDQLSKEIIQSLENRMQVFIAAQTPIISSEYVELEEKYKIYQTEKALIKELITTEAPDVTALRNSFYNLNNPIIGYLRGFREDYYKSYQKDLLSVFFRVNQLKSNFNYVEGVLIIEELKEILISIVHFEISLLTKNTFEAIEDEIYLRQLEVRVLSWINGDYKTPDLLEDLDLKNSIFSKIKLLD